MRPRPGFAVRARLAAAAALIALAGARAEGAEFVPSASDWGGAGLMQTRNARFGADGLFSAGFSAVDPYRRYFLNLQALPWLEGTFRYTLSTDPRFAADGTGNTILDRGFDVKFKLLGESAHFPALALGFQDLLGTGLFQSEYLVFSRRYYDWDFSLGLAWGRQGSRGLFRNPFTYLSDGFRRRDSPGDDEGGQVELQNFFNGERVGLFAGVEYITPLEGLRLKLELDGNDFESEPNGVALDTDLPLNFGLVYDPWPWVSLALGLERGNTAMMRVAIGAPLEDLSGVPKFAEPPPPLPPEPDGGGGLALGPGREDRSADRSADRVASAPALSFAPATADRLFDLFEARGLVLEEVALEQGDARLVIAPPPLSAAGWRALAVDAAGVLAGVPGRIAIVSREPAGEWIWASVTQPERLRAAALGVGPALSFPAAEPAEPAGQPFDSAALAARLFEGLAAAGFAAAAVEIGGDEILVAIDPGRYRESARAAGRAARVVVAASPPSFRIVSIVIRERGLEIRRVRFLRQAFLAGTQGRASAAELWASSRIEPSSPLGPAARINPDRYPAFSWALEPKFRQHIGRSDAFARAQLLVQLSGEVELARGVFAGAGFGVDVANNIDGLSDNNDSTLPRVRSNIVRYLQEGEQSLQFLDAHYLFQPAGEWYGRLSGGYLEEMFAGVGAELLYRPFGARWALGAELNQVWQREFAQRLGLLEGDLAYNVLTGHLSAYYQMPSAGLEGALHAGRYLARDWGGTLELARTFASGVRVGAWATLTDVSPAQFGEGSFDKGFYISIPIELFFPDSRRGTTSFSFRPLSRDGGQRLVVRNRLYDLTRDADLGLFAAGWGRLFD